MSRQNLIQPLVLIAISLGAAGYAVAELDAILFACACLVVALGWFELRQTVLFNSDVEKLCGGSED